MPDFFNCSIPHSKDQMRLQTHLPPSFSNSQRCPGSKRSHAVAFLSRVSLLVTPLSSAQGYVCAYRLPTICSRMSLCVWEPREVSPQNRIKPRLVLCISEIPPGPTFSGDHQPSFIRNSVGISLRLSLSPEPFCPAPAEHFLLEHTKPEVGGGKQA